MFDQICFREILKNLDHFMNVGSLGYFNILILKMGKAISQVKYLFHLCLQSLDSLLVRAFCESRDNGKLCMKRCTLHRVLPEGCRGDTKFDRMLQ